MNITNDLLKIIMSSVNQLENLCEDIYINLNGKK